MECTEEVRERNLIEKLNERDVVRGGGGYDKLKRVRKTN